MCTYVAYGAHMAAQPRVVDIHGLVLFFPVFVCFIYLPRTRSTDAELLYLSSDMVRQQLIDLSIFSLGFVPALGRALANCHCPKL